MALPTALITAATVSSQEELTEAASAFFDGPFEFARAEVLSRFPISMVCGGPTSRVARSLSLSLIGCL